MCYERHCSGVSSYLNFLLPQGIPLSFFSAFSVCNLYSHSETSHGESLWIDQTEQIKLLLFIAFIDKQIVIVQVRPWWPAVSIATLGGQFTHIL